MNLHDFIQNSEKEVTTINILRDKGVSTLLKLRENAVLKEHQSMTNAILVLLSGAVIYRERERQVMLTELHDMVRIPAKVTHKLTATKDALLLLIQ